MKNDKPIVTTPYGILYAALDADVTTFSNRIFGVEAMNQSLNNIEAANTVRLYNYDLRPRINGKEYQGLEVTVKMREAGYFEGFKEGGFTTSFKPMTYSQFFTDAALKHLNAILGDNMRHWVESNIDDLKKQRIYEYLCGVREDAEECNKKTLFILYRVAERLTQHGFN